MTFRPKIKTATINKNKTFLNTVIKEIKQDTLKITALIEQFGVDRSLFYVAYKLGYFTRTHVTKNKYQYAPTVNKFSFEDVYKITFYANGQVAECKTQMPKVTNEPPPLPASEQPPPITITTTPSPRPLEIYEKLKQAEKQGMQRLTNHIIATHLSNETDEDLIAELKRRGYSGTIEIKKTVTI
jgi:hypothetical protein